MRNAIWIILVVLYGGFWFWFNGTAGKLTPAEVDHYVSIFEERGAPASRLQTIREFLEEDDGGDFIMVNLIQYNKEPIELEGETLTAQQALAEYMSFMLPEMLKRGSMPVAQGQVVGGFMDRMGITQNVRWDAVGLVRYRSRRDVMEIATNPQFQGYHHYKDAAMSTTFAVPVTNWLLLITLQIFVPLVLLLIGLISTRFVRKY